MDNKIKTALQKEQQRQQDNIELIASENYTSSAVRELQGSILTNKYAEGYPGKRYYGGCENVDTIENLAIEYACQLFHCQHANVQPHSGSQANMEAYAALLNPGDRILSMDLRYLIRLKIIRSFPQKCICQNQNLKTFLRGSWINLMSDVIILYKI